MLLFNRGLLSKAPPYVLLASGMLYSPGAGLLDLALSIILLELIADLEGGGMMTLWFLNFILSALSSY